VARSGGQTFPFLPQTETARQSRGRLGVRLKSAERYCEYANGHRRKCPNFIIDLTPWLNFLRQT
jgi:hypothetical protein